MKAKYAYSVVLMRPRYLCDDVPFGENCYVAWVTTTTPEAAIKSARKQLFNADKRDGYDPVKPEDYHPLVVFDGHSSIRRFGWQQ